MPLYANRVIAGVPTATELYYNIQVKNNNTGFDSSGNPVPISSSVPLIFDEARSAPYIDRPADYYMSVISFQVDTASLPVFICEPVVGCNDINKTIYYVTITDASNIVVGHECVIWEPQDLSAPVPVGTAPANYSSYPYYYSYDFTHFINLVNKAITTAVTGITPYAPIAPAIVLNDCCCKNTVLIKAPYDFITDASGNCVDLSGNANPSGFKLFMNTELYNLFSAFNSVYQPDSYTGIPNANNQLIFSVNPSGLNLEKVYTDITAKPFPSGPNYDVVVSKSEYSPLAFWNPVDTLVFTVYQLSVAPELFGTNSTFGESKSQADQYYILTDYCPNLLTGTEFQPNIIYEPIAEYRLCDLYGVNPLNQLKMAILWKDKFGASHPMTIESGGVASVKILFRKKYLE